MTSLARSEHRNVMTSATSSGSANRPIGTFAVCAASAKFKVKPGKHTLEVRAIDQAGNVDPTPAKAKWKVKR